VCDDGYGVSYMVVDDDNTFFHVSSKHSSPHTSSVRFVGHLQQAFADIHALWDGVDLSAPATRGKK
jgi:hypothetical protein